NRLVDQRRPGSAARRGVPSCSAAGRRGRTADHDALRAVLLGRTRPVSHRRDDELETGGPARFPRGGRRRPTPADGAAVARTTATTLAPLPGGRPRTCERATSDRPLAEAAAGVPDYPGPGGAAATEPAADARSPPRRILAADRAGR